MAVKGDVHVLPQRGPRARSPCESLVVLQRGLVPRAPPRGPRGAADLAQRHERGRRVMVGACRSVERQSLRAAGPELDRQTPLRQQVPAMFGCAHRRCSFVAAAHGAGRGSTPSVGWPTMAVGPGAPSTPPLRGSSGLSRGPAPCPPQRCAPSSRTVPSRRGTLLTRSTGPPVPPCLAQCLLPTPLSLRPLPTSDPSRASPRLCPTTTAMRRTLKPTPTCGPSCACAAVRTPFWQVPLSTMGAHRTAPRVRTEWLPTPDAPVAPPETAEHALLDCETYATLRAHPRFAHLFSSPLPPGGRLRAFVRLPDQHALAAFVYECFEIRSRVD